jgi:hypothetical protein
MPSIYQKTCVQEEIGDLLHEWHVEGTFDTVCEVKGSDWVDELSAAAPPEWRNQWVIRHFMIYVDSFGCLEVVAESVSLEGNGSKNSAGT